MRDLISKQSIGDATYGPSGWGIEPISRLPSTGCKTVFGVAKATPRADVLSVRGVFLPCFGQVRRYKSFD